MSLFIHLKEDASADTLEKYDGLFKMIPKSIYLTDDEKKFLLSFTASNQYDQDSISSLFSKLLKHEDTTEDHVKAIAILKMVPQMNLKEKSYMSTTRAV